MLSLPRVIFASNRRCEAGVQKDPCLQASGTRTPAANLENLLKSSADGDAELLPKFGAAPAIIAVGPGKLHGGYWYGWVLLRLFPLNYVE